MPTSSNKTIQKLMDEAEGLDENDTSIEDKLQKIAEAVAAEQLKHRSVVRESNFSAPVDPQDQFQCDACQ